MKLLLAQCELETEITNSLIGLASHLLPSCSTIDLAPFQTLLATPSSHKNACRSAKLLLDSPITLLSADLLFDPLFALVRDHALRKTYAPAAHVLGQVLSWMSRDCSHRYTEAVNQFNDLCMALFRNQVWKLE